jgi:hypothetical protein
VKVLTINNRWALGDTVCLSALIRDLALAHPGRHQVRVTGHYGSFWENNPHCRVGAEGAQGTVVRLDYVQGIRAAGRGSKIHFLSWFHKDFEAKTGLKVPVTLPKGDIHLSPAERKKRFFDYRYWVVVAGGKIDMTAKVWYPHRYQEVVDKLLAQGVRCVQAGAAFKNHFHPDLLRCDSAIGLTNSIRDLFSLVYHAEGVICGVTGAMHIAAAFDKPCVVVAGGREEPWWEGYYNASPSNFGPGCAEVKVPHKFLHTVGLLDCGCGNLQKGCWKDRTVPLDEKDRADAKKRKRMCLKVVRSGPQPMPECMVMITSDHVVEGVMDYYEKGVLPPIGKPKKTFETATYAGTPKGEENPLQRMFEEAKEAVASGQQAPPSGQPFNRGVTSNVRLPIVDEVDDATIDVIRHGWGDVMPKEFRGVDLKVLDHPDVGGKLTAFVLGYGDHLDLIKRCLDSILANSPRERLEIRVGLNQPSKRVHDYVFGLHSQIRWVTVDDGDRRKYPAMRQMFWDRDCPIETRYVLWFDDDSHVNSADWLQQLGKLIVENHAAGVRMYGTKYEHDLMHYRRQGFRPERWFREATWWRNRPLTVGGGREGPNGSKIVFCTGGFWALATDVIREADIPDVRLNHNGGDICLGEQVHQAGYGIKDFCRGKRPVAWSDAKRRGFHEDFPWAKVK